MQDKRPKNEQGKPHGLWELYLSNNTVYYKATFINGRYFGLLEHQFPVNKVKTYEYHAR